VPNSEVRILAGLVDVLEVAYEDGGGFVPGHIRFNVPLERIRGHYPFKTSKQVVGVSIWFRKNHDAFRQIRDIVAGPLERARALGHNLDIAMEAGISVPPTTSATVGVVVFEDLQVGEVQRHFDSQTAGQISGVLSACSPSNGSPLRSPSSTSLAMPRSGSSPATGCFTAPRLAEVDWDRVSEVAAAAAAQRGVSVSVSDAWQSATEAGWQVGVETARRGATVGDLIDACARVVAVVQATAAGLDRGTAADAIRAGYAEALVGARESAWLEAKSAPWDLTTEGGRIEASQDVARFANEAGGLIVVGATTKHRSDDEVIVRVGGIRPGLLSLRRLRMILDAHVYPPVDALDLAEVPLKGSGNVIVLISIPGQREAAKPFIVHGAIVDGRVEGAFISIVRRRAEGSITIDPREIHAWLVAGRRLASGG
jgi:hypothetical protein